MEHEWLFQRCREAQRDRYETLDLWSREHFKALDCNTPVLTANRGWVAHIDLQPFDRVFAPNGSQVRVIANTGRMKGADCYEVKTSDNASIIASGNHRWTVRQKHKKRISGTDNRYITYTDHVVKTNEIMSTYQILHNPSPLEFQEKELPLDPYVLGYWLGDGSKGTPHLTVGYQDIDEFEKIMENINISYKTKEYEKYVRVSLGCGKKGVAGSNPVTNALREIGVLNTKRIPHIYKTASISQRFSLLCGLMDSDGTCDNRGTATFVNSNKMLAEQVKDLIVSLGVTANFREHKIKDGYIFYQVSFQGCKLKSFRIRRKLAKCKDRSFEYPRRITSVETVETRDVNCIQVEGGNYLAGRDLVPTHNSTILTFGLNLQDILASHGDDPLPRFEGQEVTIGMFSHTKSAAKAFLREIKEEFERNQYLKDLFPDILYQDPERESPTWNQDEIRVKRKANRKEETIEAHSILSLPTGKHFWMLHYDDIVTEESVTSDDMILSTTQQLGQSYNLASDGGHKRFIGTFYHFNDTLRQLQKQDIYKTRFYPATDTGKIDGKPVFWTPRYYEMKKREAISSYVFACQILLDPIADDAQSFSDEWLRFCAYQDGTDMNVYITVDPAGEKKKGSDYTVMLVIGLGADGNYYLLDGIRDRLNLAERARTLMELHREWRPKAVGYEKYGKDSDIEHIKYVQEEERYRFDIIPLGGAQAKNDRIRRLIGPFENSKFYLPNYIRKQDYEQRGYDLVQEFIKEYKEFPFSEHDDILDCAARVLETNLNTKFPKLVAKRPRSNRQYTVNNRYNPQSW